jgi:hypothetical protein
MQTGDLRAVAVDAAQLQNGYAVAIDTRDWDYFATLFAPDVVAVYPNDTYEGISTWLEFFVAFHDGCLWTQHVMSTHLVGADEHGIWASCYGSVRWVHQDEPDRINHSEVIYRDRLERSGASWRIARRRLDLVLQEPSVAIPAGLTLPNSILDFADMS